MPTELRYAFECTYIDEAVLAFQEHRDLLKEMRNAFGGHVSIAYVEKALCKLEPEEIGKVVFKADDDLWALKLEFSASLFISGLRRESSPQRIPFDEFFRAVDVIGKLFVHAQGATLALVHVFCGIDWGNLPLLGAVYD